MNFDVIIRGGVVVDGSKSAKRVRADVGIIADTIEAVGGLGKARARRVIDASGKIVAPGFIDMHGHSDFASLSTPTVDSKVRSGVTTEVLSQCGMSPFPLRGETLKRRQDAFEGGKLRITWKDIDGYVAEADKRGCSVNRVLMAGHNSIRGSVMGYVDRAPTPLELKQMVREVEIAMEWGVFGLTTGLIYPPGCYAKTDEIVELCRPAAAAGALYCSHIRGEGETLEKAVNEVLEIHKRARLPVHISHLKCYRRSNWHKIAWLKKRLFSARKAGADVTADRYPYTASSTGLDSMLPEWAHVGSVNDMLRRLKNPRTRRKIREEVLASHPGDEDWQAAMVSECAKKKNRKWEGKRLADVARALNLHPFDALCELLISDKGQTGGVFFHMSDEILEEILRWPFVMIGSDSSARSARKSKTSGKPHPRTYGTSARVLGRYGREKRILTLQEALWKLSAFPAERLGLADRGRIQRNRKADIVVFDENTVSDKATYEDPHRYSVGFEQVLVNGVLTVEKGKHLGALAGKVLKRS
jgi:N-acyl-D-amino-acid deacylase